MSYLPDSLPFAMGVEEECDRLAAAQHGVLSRRQALAEGLPKGSIDRRVSSGRWRILQPGVYAPRPVPLSWHQFLMAAVLSGGPGALASHRSAAALWRLDGVKDPPLEISIKAGRRIEGVIVHRRSAFDDPPTEVIDRIPVTGIERTLLDLAAVAPVAVVGPALDAACRRRRTSLRRVRGALDSLGPRGRPGSKALRRLVDARDHRDAAAESALESALLQILRKHALPLPSPQYRVLDGDRFVARLDFAYPSLRVGIEADGYRWHASPERWRRDLRRENHLKLLGWTLLRFSWEDVHERPEVVASQVRAALAGDGLSTGGQNESYTPS